MTTLTPEQIAEGRRLEAAATKGPWCKQSFDESQLPIISGDNENPMIAVVGIGARRKHGQENADFVCFLRNNAAALLAAAAERDELAQQVCDECNGDGWKENRVEGRYPCVCMTEREPYQLLAAQLREAREALHLAEDVFITEAKKRRDAKQPEAAECWSELAYAMNKARLASLEPAKEEP